MKKQINATHLADANKNSNVEKQTSELIKSGPLTPFGESIKLLRALADLQNDAPLEQHRQEWEETMEQVYDFLNRWDANDSSVEQLREIAKNGKLHFVDVTFGRNSYPINVGEYRALIGFKDQQDAQLFAELTGGEFSHFFKKDRWHLLLYRGWAQIANIYQLAGSYQVVYLDGGENLNQICEKVHGISLVAYIRWCINNNDVPDAWIRTAVELYETGKYQYSLVINNRDEDYYNKIKSDIIECLRFFMNFKGLKGYIVIDDVIWWSVLGEYNSEYPAHYHEDTENYIFGVMYKADREEEIRELIEG